MSNHYLVVDDARRVYFDCDKFLPLGRIPAEGPPPDTLTEQPFEPWLRTVNWDDDPPAQSDRYRVSLEDGRAIYTFLVESGWKARIVNLDSDDWDAIYEPWAREEGRDSYKCVGALLDEDKPGVA